MDEWKERLIFEKADVDVKILRLKAFINSDTFKELNEVDRNLLEKQLKVMQDYSDVLYRRFVRF